MSDTLILTLISFAIPFVSFVIMFWVVSYYNRRTTAEIKWIVPPEVWLKIMTVILVVDVVFILTYLKIMEISVTAAILGSVVTGAITSLKKSEKE